MNDPPNQVLYFKFQFLCKNGNKWPPLSWDMPYIMSWWAREKEQCIFTEWIHFNLLTKIVWSLFHKFICNFLHISYQQNIRFSPKICNAVSLTLPIIKGIFSDSNNIFLWHESGDVYKTNLFSIFQVYKLCMICVFKCTIDYCVVVYDKLTIALISRWKQFQLNSFGEMCFLEKNFIQIDSKIQIFKNVRTASMKYFWVCL